MCAEVDLKQFSVNSFYFYHSFWIIQWMALFSWMISVEIETKFKVQCHPLTSKEVTCESPESGHGKGRQKDKADKKS